MAEDLCLLNNKDSSFIIKVPKKSPLVSRMVLLLFAMVCGVYICPICLKQINTQSRPKLVVPFMKRPCPAPAVEKGELRYLHYPKPITYQSGWFETLLNSHINVSSSGEIFSNKERRSNISSIVNTSDKVYNLDWFSSASKNECSAAVGFKWMLNQGLLAHQEHIVEYFNRRGVSAVFLFRRNLLRRLISAEILAQYKPTINATLFTNNLKVVENTAAKALEYLNSARHIIVYYEDLISNKTKLAEVQGFLRVPLMDLKSRQVKIQKGSLADHVQNWDDVNKTLTGAPYERYLYADYEM
ncbi:hypothetical protein MKX01_019202 [Papaver californicum]|nr:hypothetical protein MKX01_019202 [Papaver californicum]